MNKFNLTKSTYNKNIYIENIYNISLKFKIWFMFESSYPLIHVY